MKTFAYRVAGLVFTVEYPDFSVLPERMDNLHPFVVEALPESPLFSVRLSESPLPSGTERLFLTEDGEGFPEIGIFAAPDGAHIFRTAIEPGQPVACEMLVSKDFRSGTVHLTGVDDCFGLNNCLMLLFAFAGAAEGVLEMHASVIMNGGYGYLFLGRSGTGKSTHSRLWLKHISGSELLNDDNPILRLLPDGSVRVFGSPWSGKTPCYKAKDVPVGAVVRLEQAPYNKIARLSPLEAYASLMGSASSFRPFRALADAWHETLNAMVPQVPCFKLECLPDREAALLCHQNVKRDAQAGDTH